MTAPDIDVIDHLVGIETGSRLDALRRLRPQARENAQASYLALLVPDEPGEATPVERHAVAAFVAELHDDPAVSGFYAARLAALSTDQTFPGAVAAAARESKTQGPYGSFPKGRLSAEDKAGPVYAPGRAALGARLAAAFAHAHMLVFHPRDADAAALQALLDAGWSSGGVVTLSQLVAFLAFQIRVVEGVRVLAQLPPGA